MSNKRTYYHLILDRSGSMSSCIEQTIEGVNSQINRIREVGDRFPEQELITSLTLFNNKVTQAWDRLIPGQLREITFSDYRPCGTTALFDAIGITIAEILRMEGPEIEDDRASVVMVIITDGYENSSTAYSEGKISALIRELEMTGNWTFTYIGATFDAVEIATSLGVKVNNAMRFKTADSLLMYNRINDSLYSYIHHKQSGDQVNGFLNKEEEID